MEVGGLCVGGASAFFPGNRLLIPCGRGVKVFKVEHSVCTAYFRNIISGGQFRKLLYVSTSSSGDAVFTHRFLGFSSTELALFELIDDPEKRRKGGRTKKQFSLRQLGRIDTRDSKFHSLVEGALKKSVSDARPNIESRSFLDIHIAPSEVCEESSKAEPAVPRRNPVKAVIVLNSRCSPAPNEPSLDIVEVIDLEFPEKGKFELEEILESTSEGLCEWKFACSPTEEPSQLGLPNVGGRAPITPAKRSLLSHCGRYLTVSINSTLFVFERQRKRLIRCHHVDHAAFTTLATTGDVWLCTGDRLGRNFWWNVFDSSLYLEEDSVQQSGKSLKLTQWPSGFTARATNTLSQAVFCGLGGDSFARIFSTADSPSAQKFSQRCETNITSSLTRKIVVLKQHWHSLGVIAATSVGRYIVTGGEEGVLVFWHSAQNDRFFASTCGSPIVQLSSWSGNDQNLLAVGLANNSIRVFDVASQKIIATFHGLYVPESMIRVRRLMPSSSYEPDVRAPLLRMPVLLSSIQSKSGLAAITGHGGTVHLYDFEQDAAPSSAPLAVDGRSAIRLSTSRLLWSVTQVCFAPDLSALATVECRHMSNSSISDPLDKYDTKRQYYDSISSQFLRTQAKKNRAKYFPLGNAAIKKSENKNIQSVSNHGEVSDADESNDGYFSEENNNYDNEKSSINTRTYSWKASPYNLDESKYTADRRYCGRPGVATYELAFSPDGGDELSNGKYYRIKFWDIPTESKKTVATSKAGVHGVFLEESRLVSQLENIHRHHVTALRVVPSASADAADSADQDVDDSEVIGEVTGPWRFVSASLDGYFKVYSRHFFRVLDTTRNSKRVKLTADYYACTHTGTFRNFPIFDLHFSVDGTLGAVAHRTCISLWGSANSEISTVAAAVAFRGVDLGQTANTSTATAVHAAMLNTLALSKIRRAQSIQPLYERLTVFARPLEDNLGEHRRGLIIPEVYTAEGRNLISVLFIESALEGGLPPTSTESGAEGILRLQSASFLCGLWEDELLVWNLREATTLIRHRFDAPVFGLIAASSYSPFFAACLPSKKQLLVFTLVEKSGSLELIQTASVSVSERLIGGTLIDTRSSVPDIVALDQSFSATRASVLAGTVLPSAPTTTDVEAVSSSFADVVDDSAGEHEEDGAKTLLSETLSKKKSGKKKKHKDLLEAFLIAAH